MITKVIRANQGHAEESEEGLSFADPFWRSSTPTVELPDPTWTVDARYDILSGGARPGGALSILGDKIQAEVEQSNEKALAEGLHLLQLPGPPDGEVTCTRCGGRKPWQYFHTFARRICIGAATAGGDDGELPNKWKDVNEGWAMVRRKNVFAKRSAALAARQPELSAAEKECLVGTEEYPRPCDPKSVRAVRARTHAERKRRVASGDWSPAREFPDWRAVPVASLLPVTPRRQLQEEMMAWEKDRRQTAARPRGKKGFTAMADEATQSAAAMEDEGRR